MSPHFEATDLAVVIPALEGPRVLVVSWGGPGAARNLGVGSTDKQLVLLLGDDMIPAPELVEQYLLVHRQHPEPEIAALGHIDWDPRSAGTRLSKWLDWSGTQFESGGFDTDFDYYFLAAWELAAPKAEAVPQ